MSNGDKARDRRLTLSHERASARMSAKQDLRKAAHAVLLGFEDEEDDADLVPYYDSSLTGAPRLEA